MTALPQPKPTRCPHCGFYNGGAFSVCPLCKEPLSHFAQKFYRFVERIPIAGCWLWAGSVGENGYGRAHSGEYGTARSTAMGAHRLSWLMHKGPIPDGLQVCHRCDVKACVNPDHLFVGTPLDNIRDCVAKGRARRGRLSGERHGRAKLTEKDVIAIRASNEPSGVLAKRFGVTWSTVDAARTGKHWKHVPHLGDTCVGVAALVVGCIYLALTAGGFA